MKTSILFCIATFALLFGISAVKGTFADTPAVTVPSAPRYVPQQSPVALLPVIDATGGKKPNDKAVANAKSAFMEEMTKRGFPLVDDTKVSAAISSLKIDLSDEEQQKRDTLYKVGGAVGARLVAFIIVTSVDQREVDHFFSTSREGQSTVKIWLVDVSQQYPWLSAKTFQGKDKGRYYTEHKGSDLAARAVGNAVQNALAEFVVPYPEVKKDK